MQILAITYQRLFINLISAAVNRNIIRVLVKNNAYTYSCLQRFDADRFAGVSRGMKTVKIPLCSHPCPQSHCTSHASCSTSFDSPLPSSTTPSLSHSWLKTHLSQQVTGQQRAHTTPSVHTMSSYHGMDASLYLGFALCCHSNATRAPIANPPNSAQLGGIPYH